MLLLKGPNNKVLVGGGIVGPNNKVLVGDEVTGGGGITSCELEEGF